MPNQLLNTPPPRGLEQQRDQRDHHGAAEHHRPVAHVETEKPALVRRKLELRHRRPLFLSLPCCR